MRLAKLITICLVVLASSYAVTQDPDVDPVAGPNYATVLGRVLYANGTPVEGAEVAVSTFGAFAGILPRPVHTDKEGRYKITYPPLGDGFIGASKLAEGYPSPLWRLYDTDYKADTVHGETPSRKRIDLRAGGILENVDFVLEHPNPVVTFQVQDSTSGRPIDNARLVITWPPGDVFMGSPAVPKDGAYVLVLPDHPVSLTFSAPGHIDWHWKADLAQAKSAGTPFAMHTTVVVPLAQAGP
jgi:hypothetical protein